MNAPYNQRLDKSMVNPEETVQSRIAIAAVISRWSGHFELRSVYKYIC